MENKETIGAKIVALRKSRGYTQADLGAYLNISYQAVSKWERDESCPDFETLSKIAQMFGVPISYFESGNSEVAVAAVKTAEVESQTQPKREMLGVCKDCGQVVYEDTIALRYPTLLCKQCDTRRKKVAEAKAEEQRRAEEKRRQEAKRQAQAKLAKGKALRNKGIIWGAIIAGLLALAGISADVLGALVTGAFLFFFISQLFWDGAVVSCATAGSSIIGTPGVIFELSLDGFIFLIAVKLLFALLRFAIFLFTSAVCILVAILISPFTFVPAMRRVSVGE